jgi:hypothetical protein
LHAKLTSLRHLCICTIQWVSAFRYGGHANIDHDDGGWRYVDEDNLCVYGTIENHDGTEKLYRNNLVVFPGVANHSQ